MTLPEGWVETTLSEIATFNPKHDPASDLDQLVSFIPMPAVDEHSGTITSTVDRPLREVWSGFPHFADGDVIFAKITPCMENGKAAVASKLSNGMACGSTEFFVLRPSAGVQASYIWRYLRQRSFRASAETHMTGAVGQRRVPRKYLENHRLGLPPAAEQRRIVAKLEALTASVRRARADLERVNALADDLRASTIVAAMRGDLTVQWREQHGLFASPTADTEDAYERMVGVRRRKPALSVEWKPEITIPLSWRWASVDELVGVVQYGTSAKTTDDAEGVPVLRMGNIQRGTLDWTKLKYLPASHDEFPSLFLMEGDVLFNRTNSPELVGKAAVYRSSERASFASYLIRVRCSAILPDMLVRYLNSPIGREWVAQVASQQVGQANVNGTKLRALGIPLPPMAEQIEMNRLLNAAFARADRLEAEATRAHALLDRLEAAILGKAFCGELVPQDPNDEPASVLLDRIRAERAAAPKPKRGRALKAVG